MYMMQRMPRDLVYGEKAIRRKEINQTVLPGQFERDMRKLPRYSKNSVRKISNVQNEAGHGFFDGSSVIQRTSASFLQELPKIKRTVNNTSIDYDEHTHRISINPDEKLLDNKRLKLLAMAWRWVTNIYFGQKDGWGTHDSVSVYFILKIIGEFRLSL